MIPLAMAASIICTLDTRNIGAMITGSFTPVISVKTVFIFMQPKYQSALSATAARKDCFQLHLLF